MACDKTQNDGGKYDEGPNKEPLSTIGRSSGNLVEALQTEQKDECGNDAGKRKDNAFAVAGEAGEEGFFHGAPFLEAGRGGFGWRSRMCKCVDWTVAMDMGRPAANARRKAKCF